MYVYTLLLAFPQPLVVLESRCWTLSAGAATPSCAAAGALDVQFLKGTDAKDGDLDYK